MWMAINESLGLPVLCGAYSGADLVPVHHSASTASLVSTMVGQGRRWGSFLMRLPLSIMFGFIIAEPLTIRIFQTAIEQHIQDGRSQEIDDLRSELLRCNTKEIATSSAPAPSGCGGSCSRLTRPRSRRAGARGKRADEIALAATVDADGAEAARLRDMAAKECAGTAGTGAYWRTWLWAGLSGPAAGRDRVRGVPSAQGQRRAAGSVAHRDHRAVGSDQRFPVQASSPHATR